MRDRLSSFSNPEIIKLLQEEFIPATDNDWYNRRRKDAAGDFFRKVAAQGPRGEGDGTKQGHYILTASGKLLGYNNNRDLDNRLRFIRDAHAKWDSLPEKEKSPGAVKVPELVKTDGKYHATPPEGGVVLVASQRLLKSADGKMAACTADDHDHAWGHMAAVDRMWIQPEEWRELLATAKAGGALSDRLAMRLARYHLLDITRGEPPFWKRDEVKTADITVSAATTAGEITLSGSVHLSTADGKRGYEANLLGAIKVDKKDRPSRFDIVVLGDHWGDGPFTKGARPGKTPLGMAFSLADPDKPADQIRPQGSHWIQGYWEAEKQH